MPNYFFLNVFTLQKELQVIILISLESRILANYYKAIMTIAYFAYLCNFINMIFYFRFQKFSIIDKLAVKFYFYISGGFIRNSITAF